MGAVIGPKELERRTLRERAAEVLSRVLRRRETVPAAFSDVPDSATVTGDAGAEAPITVQLGPIRSAEYVDKAVTFYESHLASSREAMRRSRARKKAAGK